MEESTVRWERAAPAESTKARERAEAFESTENRERAAVAESTVDPERAVLGESTVAAERADTAESTDMEERRYFLALSAFRCWLNAIASACFCPAFVLGTLGPLALPDRSVPFRFAPPHSCMT